MPFSLTNTLARHVPVEAVPDLRHRRGVRYPFLDLLHIIVCAVICGAGTLTMIAEWAREAVTAQGFPPGTRIPSLTTFHRVIAVDGKEVRGAKNGGGGRVFLMAALDHATGTVIGPESIGEKTNEIPHFAVLDGQDRGPGGDGSQTMRLDPRPTRPQNR